MFGFYEVNGLVFNTKYWIGISTIVDIDEDNVKVSVKQICFAKPKEHDILV
jgi:hypothetical protein